MPPDTPARRFALPLRAEREEFDRTWRVLDAKGDSLTQRWLTEAEAREFAAAHEMRGLLEDVVKDPYRVPLWLVRKIQEILASLELENGA